MMTWGNSLNQRLQAGLWEESIQCVLAFPTCPLSPCVASIRLCPSFWPDKWKKILSYSFLLSFCMNDSINDTHSLSFWREEWCVSKWKYFSMWLVMTVSLPNSEALGILLSVTERNVALEMFPASTVCTLLKRISLPIQMACGRRLSSSLPNESEMWLAWGYSSKTVCVLCSFCSSNIVHDDIQIQWKSEAFLRDCVGLPSP